MPTAPLEGFIEVNGVCLQYLEWGESGSPLLLIPGLAATPYDFDHLAGELADQYHIFSVCRRGCGNSERRGPYNLQTLTEDLQRALDALNIEQTVIAGSSAGGDEATALASEMPDRVKRLIYLDAAYDFADPEHLALNNALPSYTFTVPPAAGVSLDAFRSFQKLAWYPDVDDIRRIEASLRQSAILQEDGTVRVRTSIAEREAMYAALHSNKRRDYSRVRCPALAIYSERCLDVNSPDPDRRADALAWESQFWEPFRRKSIEKIRRELPGVQIVEIPNSKHSSYHLAHRELVVSTMRQFLSGA